MVKRRNYEEIIKCKGCSILINRWDDWKHERTYCSNRCLVETSNFCKAKPKLYKNCKTCNNKFTRENRRDVRRAIYCSTACAINDRNHIRRSMLRMIYFGKEEEYLQPTI